MRPRQLWDLEQTLCVDVHSKVGPLPPHEVAGVSERAFDFDSRAERALFYRKLNAPSLAWDLLLAAKDHYGDID